MILVTLDFDGTVSPIAEDHNFEDEANFRIFRLGGFPCAISEEVLEFLNWLKEQEPRVRTVWASTWNEMTQHFSEDTEGAIPAFEFINTSEGKAEAILAEAERVKATKLYAFEDSTKVLHQVRNSDGENEPRIFRQNVRVATGITKTMIAMAKAEIR